MDPLKDVSSNSLYPVSGPSKRPSAGQKGFQDTLGSLISQVDSQIKEADRKAEDFATGKKYNLHEIMIAAEKADLSFRFLLQVRNKLIEAYQEIMRMNF